jgi:hypothetical protein
MEKNLDGTEKKSNAGRPVALNHTRINQAKVVLETPAVITARTDTDIVNETNYRLYSNGMGNYAISKRSYERYKNRIRNITQEDLDDMPEETKIAIEQFWRLLDKKVRDEKLLLLGNLIIADKWQKWAWIFERKFTKQWALNTRVQEVEIKSTTKQDMEDDDTVTEVEVTIVNSTVDDNQYN